MMRLAPFWMPWEGNCDLEELGDPLNSHALPLARAYLIFALLAPDPSQGECVLAGAHAKARSVCEGKKRRAKRGRGSFL